MKKNNKFDMSKRITSKELEERSKKIFNSLGLKDLDIKVYKNVNGERTSEHVHVDKDGVKADTKTGDDAAKAAENDFKESNAKAAVRLKKAIDVINSWFSGKIGENDVLNILKPVFEERCKEKFGDLDPLKLVGEIDQVTKGIFKDPFWKAVFDKMKESGVYVDQTDFDKAAQKIKEVWGYIPRSEDDDKKKDECQKNECKCGGSASCQTKVIDETEGLKDEEPTKAQKIKEMLAKKRENEARDLQVINEIYDKIDNAIEHQAYKTFNDGDIEDAGLVVFLSPVYSAPVQNLKEFYRTAGERIKKEYGFKTYNLALPSIATNNMWRYKFFF